MATKFDNIRNELIAKSRELFESLDYDVLTTGSQEICLPIVGEGGEEGYCVISFKIPKGSREGDPYDGYSVAESYKLHLEEKAFKAEENAKKKTKKIERDKKMREEKARLKAEREAKAEV